MSATVLDPTTTAVICVECQNGVVGPDSILPQLAEAAAPLIAHLQPLLVAARSAGVTVAHATYAGSLGGDLHEAAPLWRTLGRMADHWTSESDEAQVVAALSAPTDLVLPRHHGLNPARGTELLPVLRGRGARTLVLTGVSLNVALVLLAGEAVHQGFRVVIPTDGVAATPADYAGPMLDNSLRMLAHLTTAADLIDSWTPSSRRG